MRGGASELRSFNNCCINYALLGELKQGAKDRDIRVGDDVRRQSEALSKNVRIDRSE